MERDGIGATKRKHEGKVDGKGAPRPYKSSEPNKLFFLWNKKQESCPNKTPQRKPSMPVFLAICESLHRLLVFGEGAVETPRRNKHRKPKH